MAETIEIGGGPAGVKVRNPLAVVALSFVTFGIYFLFWYFFVNRELRDFGSWRNTDECGTSPWISLIAMTLGWIIIVPPFVSLYFSFKRMNVASRLAGVGEGFDAGLGLLLWILLAPVSQYIFQMKLNEAWRALGPQTASSGSAVESSSSGQATTATTE